MIDTITLFIYDIGEKNHLLGHSGVHKNLVEILKSKHSSRVEFQNFDMQGKQEIEQPLYLQSKSGKFRKKRVQKATIHRDLLFFEATGRATERFAVIGDYLPSSNYKIRYVVDYSQNFMKVEFSIPKYFFGTNILQNCDTPLSYGWEPYSESRASLMCQFSNLYGTFVSYIKKFFDIEFTGAKVDFSKVKLRRLDLCYNLVFDTKDNALLYLEAMRGIKKKHQREDTLNQTNYQTSIFLRNSDYSFKCYHKGTEYEKKDAKEHKMYNTENKSKFFNIPELQNFADRTLRFEMTFFSSYISKLFNRMVRTKKSQLVKPNITFDNYRKLFNKIQPILLNKKKQNKNKHNKHDIDLSMEKVFMLTATDPLNCPNYVAFMEIIERLKVLMNAKQQMSYYDFLYKLSGYKFQKPENDLKVLQYFYNMMNMFYAKHHQIWLKGVGFNKNDTLYNDFIRHYESSTFVQMEDIFFHKDLCNLMGKTFVDTVLQFQVSELEDFAEFKLKLEQHPPEGVEIQKMLYIYKMWCMGYDLDKQAVMFGWSKATFYKYRTRFKQMGFDRTFQKFEIPYVKFDFSAYFQEIDTQKYNKYFFINN